MVPSVALERRGLKRDDFGSGHPVIVLGNCSLLIDAVIKISSSRG
jgi:hypothetical protein